MTVNELRAIRGSPRDQNRELHTAWDVISTRWEMSTGNQVKVSITHAPDFNGTAGLEKRRHIVVRTILVEVLNTPSPQEGMISDELFQLPLLGIENKRHRSWSV